MFSGYNRESQGTALAQALFGQVNPSGHLDFTWYADNSQLPPMLNYGLTPSQTGGLGRTYMYFTGKPTYPFGYGLSYSKFTYSHINIASSRPSTASPPPPGPKPRGMPGHIPAVQVHGITGQRWPGTYGSPPAAPSGRHATAAPGLWSFSNAETAAARRAGG